MNIMKLVKLVAAAVLAVSSFAANASLLQITGGTTINVSPINDFKTNFPVAQQYTVGGNLSVKNAGTYFLTYTLIGYEASYLNSFYIDGNNSTVINNTNHKTTVITSTETLAANQLLTFAFHTVQGNATVNNGSNLPMLPGNYNFAVALDTVYTAKKTDHDSATKYYTYKGTGSYGFDAVLFLDDVKGFGTPDDDNHDDLIIGLKIVRAPEPSALLLMGLGLLGLAGVRRLKA
jgi:hypothetical protein